MVEQPYNINKVHMYIDGVAITSGLAKDSAISIKYDNPLIVRHLDASGKDGAYSNTNDLSATIEFTCLKKSIANRILTKMNLSDINGDNGGFHLVIHDNDSQIQYEASVAHVEKYADQEYGAEQKERQWSIITTRLEQTDLMESVLNSLSENEQSNVYNLIGNFDSNVANIVGQDVLNAAQANLETTVNNVFNQ